MELESRPVRVVRGPEIERSSVETSRRSERVQRKCAVARRPKRQARALRKRGSRAELQCRYVVVGHHLGVILRPAERLDPLARDPVHLGAVSSRDLSVGDVTDESMSERPLAVPGE